VTADTIKFARQNQGRFRFWLKSQPQATNDQHFLLENDSLINHSPASDAKPIAGSLDVEDLDIILGINAQLR